MSSNESHGFSGKWSTGKAWNWDKSHDWIIGFNYVPRTAVNSTEMWQADSFDLPTIAQEMKWASEIGFDSCRIFLQYIVWKEDKNGYKQRIHNFLETASSHGMTTMPILFDDCAFANKEPYSGRQDAPVAGIHNSGWTPSPGPVISDDPDERDSLEEYVMDIVSCFGKDKRVIAWDLYNEPGNGGRGERSTDLLRDSFRWARSVLHEQPLTSGIWSFDQDDSLGRAQLELSDVISFHSYGNLETTEAAISKLKTYGRPIFCTEWLHRPNGSLFQTHIPLFSRERIGSYIWGLVLGKTQTNLSWGTMTGKPDAAPTLWQHDVLREDGSGYDIEEVQYLKSITNGMSANPPKPPKVFVAFLISQEAEQALGAFCEYEKWNDDEIHTEALFAEKIKDKDGLLLDGGLRLNKAILDQAPHLRAISNASVGYDNFDLAVMKQRGIVGMNTPGVLEDTVADLAFGLMLSVARRLCELDAYVKAGKWQPEDDEVHFGMEVHHKTLGIIGMGRIGEVVADRAIHGFHMNVLYCSRNRKPSAEARLGTEYAAMTDLLKRSDFVVVITPYTSETHHMIGTEQFAMMKKSAILINISRGKTVDEKALIFALQNHVIAGAGLDVFNTEPIEPDNPLLQLTNVVAVPHIGSATAQTRNNMAMAAVENLRKVLGGEKTNAIVPELRW